MGAVAMVTERFPIIKQLEHPAQTGLLVVEQGGGRGQLIDLPQTGDYILYLGQHTMADEAWTGKFTLSVMVQ